MASPATIRTAIGARLNGLTAEGRKLTIHRQWPGQLNPPCAVVLPGDAEPNQTFGRGELTRWTFDVHLFVPLSAGYEAAQTALDPLLATSSTGGVFGAIATDPTLGGVVDTTFVRRFTEYDQADLPNLSCAACVIELEVWST